MAIEGKKKKRRKITEEALSSAANQSGAPTHDKTLETLLKPKLSCTMAGEQIMFVSPLQNKSRNKDSFSFN